MPHAPAIDGLEFARHQSRLSGTRRAGRFVRLRELLRGDAGSVHYELQGLPEVQGRPALRLEISGSLPLLCQRCLGPLDHPLRAAALLLLYEDEAELAARPLEVDGPEAILAGREMSVLELVEDEMLLAVPQAPKHERCAPHSGAASPAQQRPFAGLRRLLNGGEGRW